MQSRLGVVALSVCIAACEFLTGNAVRESSEDVVLDDGDLVTIRWVLQHAVALMGGLCAVAHKRRDDWRLSSITWPPKLDFTRPCRHRHEEIGYGNDQNSD